MFKKIGFLVLSMLLLLSACSRLPAASGSAEPTSAGYAQLVAALEASGAKVEPVGEVTQDFFSVKGQVLKVNGEDVQVFEYASEAERQADSDQINPDGSVGTSMILWIAPPHWFAEGKLIVLYLGEDEAMLNLLGSLLVRG
jgi:hypothetical protein